MLSDQLDMGACFSCCGGRESRRTSSSHAVTEQDVEARMRAAERAVARQQEFEKSAVGKATIKAVKAAKQREQRPEGPDLAQDWRS